MIELNNTHYIGEGEIRLCYEHPEDKNLCIKIPRQETTREYTLKELLYFKKLSKRNKTKYAYRFYSDFYQETETNKGLGQVFDLIRDETSGDISKTLEYYLQKPTLIEDSKLWNAIELLKCQMTKFKVFTRDLRARNICCKILLNNEVQLVIIDGLGHRDFFPLADYFSYFTKKKISRTFKKWHFTSIEDQVDFLNRESNK